MGGMKTNNLTKVVILKDTNCCIKAQQRTHTDRQNESLKPKVQKKCTLSMKFFGVTSSFSLSLISFVLVCFVKYVPIIVCFVLSFELSLISEFLENRFS